MTLADGFGSSPHEPPPRVRTPLRAMLRLAHEHRDLIVCALAFVVLFSA
jgi:MFS family permease